MTLHRMRPALRHLLMSTQWKCLRHPLSILGWACSSLSACMSRLLKLTVPVVCRWCLSLTQIRVVPPLPGSLVDPSTLLGLTTVPPVESTPSWTTPTGNRPRLTLSVRTTLCITCPELLLLQTANRLAQFSRLVLLCSTCMYTVRKAYIYTL